MRIHNAGMRFWAVVIVAFFVVSGGCGGGGSSSSVTVTGPGTGAAGPYDITFTGSGYDVHNGETLRVALVRVSNGAIQSTQSATVSGGTFNFVFENALAGGDAHRLDYYADVNANSLCDTPPADHVWSTSIAESTDNVTVNTTHNTNFDASACTTLNGNGYDLMFTGSGYDVHNGQTLHIVLTDTTTNASVFHVTGSISGGAFNFSWLGVLTSGRTYNLDYYADVDGDGVCDGPSAGEDHAWRETIAAVSNDVSITTVHTANFTAVCSTFQ